jgi:ATP-dependent Clp protease adaptor protein ClpS
MINERDNRRQGNQGSDVHGDVDVAIAPPEVEIPCNYHVMLMNDDYTPMEFVVHVLQKFFGMDKDRALHIMLQIHEKGQGICGTFVRDVAETHVVRINGYAMANNHPLRSRVEEAE